MSFSFQGEAERGYDEARQSKHISHATHISLYLPGVTPSENVSKSDLTYIAEAPSICGILTTQRTRPYEGYGRSIFYTNYNICPWRRNALEFRVDQTCSDLQQKYCNSSTFQNDKFSGCNEGHQLVPIRPAISLGAIASHA